MPAVAHHGAKTRRAARWAPVALSIASLLLLRSAGAQEPARGGPAAATGFVERTVVELAELRMLVIDRAGLAVTDLRAEEIRVVEDGEERRLAFLERVAGGRDPFSGPPFDPRPAVSAPEGPPRPDGAPIVLPPRAVRRIFLAFDVGNGRKSVRERWRLAAASWVSTGMQPGDRAGIVVLDDAPRWIAEMTDDRERLLAELEGVSLENAAEDRDRRRELSALMSDLRSCPATDDGRLAGSAGISCAYELSRPRVRRWSAEAAGTLHGLESLVGQLAAIPGRKAVLLFSDGVLDDPAMAAVHAIVARLGSAGHNLDLQKMKARLGSDVRPRLAELQRLAHAGGVSLFALDTQAGDDGGIGGGLDQSGPLPASALGIRPWASASDAMHRTLDALARDSGGRSWRGVRELADNVRAAADSFFGMYSVGYYRAGPEAPVGKVLVRIERPGIDVLYPDRVEVGRHAARTVRLELVIGAPRSVDGGERLALPLAARIAVDALPLREGNGGVGTTLGFHFSAMRSDGAVVAERLDVKTVGIGENEIDAARGKLLLHRAELVVPPGSYRVLARVGDERQQVAAQRAVDLTVDRDGVRPGLGPADP